MNEAQQTAAKFRAGLGFAGLAGLVIVALSLGLSLIGAPVLGEAAYRIDMARRLRPPSAEHWFGTDSLGRDLLARVLAGGRVSLGLGFSVGVFSGILALLIGLYGCVNRILETLLFGLCDALRSIPALLLAIALVTALGGGASRLFIVLSLCSAPATARLVRSSVLVVREQPYIQMARLQGAGPGRILFCHILPNILSPLSVQFSFTCAQTMLIEAALSFLGAGIQAPRPSWGNILQEGQTVMFSAPWLILCPGLFMALTILGINLLAGALRRP
ncbi:MAG: ABC transporter permease [Treponema sp.]|jgi:peptide/nickel transport system permease protein|nr:ABC transporter permease [Treponema sp.]